MQTEPLKYLESIGVPTTSVNETSIHASRYMSDLNSEEYQTHINILTDNKFVDCPLLTSRKHYHLAFAYLCQTIMKQRDEVGAVDPVLGFTTALDKVLYHARVNGYMFLEDDAPVEGSRNVVDGVTRHQGYKREQAIQFLKDNPKSTRDEFISNAVDKLEMSSVGAASYYYMAYEAVHGKKPPAAQRGKKVVEGKVSRRDQAIELMKADPTISRDAFINGCVEQLEMTTAGATTYYYAAYQAVHGTNPPKLARGKAAHKGG